MNAIFKVFDRPPQNSWISVGLASSFPNLGDDDGSLATPRPCHSDSSQKQNQRRPGCKVFHAPRGRESVSLEVPIALPEGDGPEPSELGGLDDAEAGDLTDQVLIFRYRGKVYAIDHSCPHSSYPLSRGIPFDIEDFGIVLSSGITCPRHGWSFDLVTGLSDRGNYKLKTWEVQLRDVKTEMGSSSDATDDNVPDPDDKEVWVRRKQRMG